MTLRALLARRLSHPDLPRRPAAHRRPTAAQNTCRIVCWPRASSWNIWVHLHLAREASSGLRYRRVQCQLLQRARSAHLRCGDNACRELSGTLSCVSARDNAGDFDTSVTASSRQGRRTPFRPRRHEVSPVTTFRPCRRSEGGPPPCFCFNSGSITGVA